MYIMIPIVIVSLYSLWLFTDAACHDSSALLCQRALEAEEGLHEIGQLS
jgi:hypothetical protein